MGVMYLDVPLEVFLNGEEMGYNLYLTMGYIEVITHLLKVDG